MKLKNWRAADSITDTLMLFIADREKERYLNIPLIENFSCKELKDIDQLWVNNSRGNFGLSVQKKIWVNTGNRLGVKISDWNQNDQKNYLRFARAVGWYNNEKKNVTESSWMRYDEYILLVNKDPSKYLGGLPRASANLLPLKIQYSPLASQSQARAKQQQIFLALRLENCNI